MNFHDLRLQEQSFATVHCICELYTLYDTDIHTERCHYSAWHQCSCDKVAFTVAQAIIIIIYYSLCCYYLLIITLP